MISILAFLDCLCDSWEEGGVIEFRFCWRLSGASTFPVVSTYFQVKGGWKGELLVSKCSVSTLYVYIIHMSHMKVKQNNTHMSLYFALLLYCTCIPLLHPRDYESRQMEPYSIPQTLFPTNCGLQREYSILSLSCTLTNHHYIADPFQIWIRFFVIRNGKSIYTSTSTSINYYILCRN